MTQRCLLLPSSIYTRRKIHRKPAIGVFGLRRPVDKFCIQFHYFYRRPGAAQVLEAFRQPTLFFQENPPVPATYRLRYIAAHCTVVWSGYRTEPFRPRHISLGRDI
jgi:hypothetical protein